MSAVDFKVVDKSFLDKLETKTRNRYSSDDNPLIKALTSGEVISVETDKPKRFQSLYQAATRRGKTMHLRSGISEGKQVVVFWWADKEEEAAAS